MKNLFYLFVALLAAGSFQACYEEEPLILAEPGVIATPSNLNPGFFNLTDLDNASVAFTLDTQGEADASSVTIFKSYNGGEPVEHATISTLPTDVTITVAAAVDGLGISADELEVGDVIALTFEVNTADGRVLRTGGSPLLINASCPSDLAGTYDVTATGTSTDPCCPDQTTVTSTVTLTDEGNGLYTISDFSGGLYLEWYDVYGITSTDDSPGTFRDVCNNLTFENTTEPFNTAVTGTGSVDGSTGVITLSWVNGYDDEATLTLTPQ